MSHATLVPSTVPTRVDDLTFSIHTTPFDEDYTPAASTRATTNFANLARGADRRENLRAALAMIDGRLNDLAPWDNPERDRYTARIEIVSIDVHFTADDGADVDFPLMEMLDVRVVERATGAVLGRSVGNNFSSYVRDHDFSVVLPAHAATSPGTEEPDGFGDLHGRLFRHLLDSQAYRERFPQPPVICISVSTSRTYRRLTNEHPVLGVEYRQDEPSRTDRYFGRMGLGIRCFLPRGAVAPLAFYSRGDLLNDHANLSLAGLIATMETFQRIYRPEIYNANAGAGEVYRPRLDHGDFSQTRIAYDREERARLGREQGEYTQEHFVGPHRDLLERWATAHAARDTEETR